MGIGIKQIFWECQDTALLLSMESFRHVDHIITEVMEKSKILLVPLSPICPSFVPLNLAGKRDGKTE
jgi:hypothetical protein